MVPNRAARNRAKVLVCRLQVRRARRPCSKRSHRTTARQRFRSVSTSQKASPKRTRFHALTNSARRPFASAQSTAPLPWTGRLLRTSFRIPQVEISSVRVRLWAKRRPRTSVLNCRGKGGRNTREAFLVRFMRIPHKLEMVRRTINFWREQ